MVFQRIHGGRTVDVYHVNAILCAVNGTVEDVEASSADVLIACTELIRQTLEPMPPDIRARIIGGVAGALAADVTSLLETVWSAPPGAPS
jgi:hypothetical protein